MPVPFARSLRSLRSDGPRRYAVATAFVGVLLVGWGLWFFLARIELREVSHAARLETGGAVHRVETVVEGRVVEAALQLGREVQAGDLLLQLDDREARLALDEARARVAALEGQLPPLRDERAAVEAAVEGARAVGRGALGEATAQQEAAAARARLATSEAERLVGLGAAGGATVAQAERAERTAEVQRSAARAARAVVSKVRSESALRAVDQRRNAQALRREIARLEGDVRTGQATIERLEVEIGQHRITAPVDGVLGEAAASLRVGAFVAAGEAIASVVPSGEVRITADFEPEAAFGRVRPGQKARMRLHGFPWTRFGMLDAEVERVGSEVRDGVVRVELTIEADPDSRIPLEHGLPGDVEVDVERISPAQLVLLSVGRFLESGGTPARADSS